mmetsp:Transcript_19886/g.48179  ORF Transcript_19886/g.48179 Transcript_19886/m.48179 type:complete len:207 (-) Transcript_19886:53-673(-)
MMPCPDSPAGIAKSSRVSSALDAGASNQWSTCAKAMVAPKGNSPSETRREREWSHLARSIPAKESSPSSDIPETRPAIRPPVGSRGLNATVAFPRRHPPWTSMLLAEHEAPTDTTASATYNASDAPYSCCLTTTKERWRPLTPNASSTDVGRDATSDRRGRRESATSSEVAGTPFSSRGGAGASSTARYPSRRSEEVAEMGSSTSP